MSKFSFLKYLPVADLKRRRRQKKKEGDFFRLWENLLRMRVGVNFTLDQMLFSYNETLSRL